MSGSPKLIQPGNPPIIWSSVEKAFRDINQNFNDLYATIQADGSTQVVNFSSLFDDVAPGVTDLYSLGSDIYRWKNLYLTPVAEGGDNDDNGLWFGEAQIRGVSGTVDLPTGATVDGDLIIDPNKTFFKGAQVDSGNQVVADEFVDTLNLNSGTAMQLVVDSAAESITFNNTGVTQATGGSGISVSSATGNITIANTGVTSATNGSSLPAGRTAGAGIAASSSTGAITLTNTGILDVTGGFGITVSVDSATGAANIVNTAPAQVTFRTIHIVDDDTANDLVADSLADTLNISAGTGIVLTNTPGTDTLAISLADRIDITGSIFADDSTLLVDAVDGVIRGPINTTGVLDGELIGSVFADDSTRVVNGTDGSVTANSLNITNVSTVQNAWFLSYNSSTGEVTKFSSDAAAFIAPTLQSSGLPSDTLLSGTLLAQGNDIDSPNLVGATGDFKGSVFADDSTVMVNAVDNTLTANSFTGTVFTSTVDSADSSAITIVPAAVFNSDVTVENELLVGNIPGYVSLATFKAEVAASTNFADFQSRIAAL